MQDHACKHAAESLQSSLVREVLLSRFSYDWDGEYAERPDLVGTQCLDAALLRGCASQSDLMHTSNTHAQPLSVTDVVGYFPIFIQTSQQGIPSDLITAVLRYWTLDDLNVLLT